MRKDSLLANKTFITPSDLQGIPIISPRSESLHQRYAQWMKRDFDTLNVVATYNLIYNAAFLVEEGVGYALCWDKLIGITDNHPLCFIPCNPKIDVRIDMTWKKHQVFSKASQKFLEKLRELIYLR